MAVQINPNIYIPLHSDKSSLFARSFNRYSLAIPLLYGELIEVIIYRHLPGVRCGMYELSWYISHSALLLSPSPRPQPLPSFPFHPLCLDIHLHQPPYMPLCFVPISILREKLHGDVCRWPSDKLKRDWVWRTGAFSYGIPSIHGYGQLLA